MIAFVGALTASRKHGGQVGHGDIAAGHGSAFASKSHTLSMTSWPGPESRRHGVSGSPMTLTDDTSSPSPQTGALPGGGFKTIVSSRVGQSGGSFDGSRHSVSPLRKELSESVSWTSLIDGAVMYPENRMRACSVGRCARRRLRLI